MQLDHSYATELPELVSAVDIKPLTHPKLIALNQSLLKELQLDPSDFEQQALIESLFTSNGVLNRNAVAQKYGGHQFGQWNPDLGDGRGLLLGEVVTNEQKRWDLHLKGAGPTPYSRFGDGRAVLRSTIREYLASEALHHLGIPTSRALCLIASKEPVYREKPEQGAMLIRVSQSHIRFGHFEYYYHSKQTDKLQALFDYTFKYHFPHCLEDDNPYYSMLVEVVKSTAKLISHWQTIGFNHGVMNSDNMSIHGITFDYGPYAFLDDYEPGFICNHSDHSGRYAFDRQPGIGLWNLNALAHGFTPYLEIEEIKSALQLFEPELQMQYAQMMRAKFGLSEPLPKDLGLVNEWLELLQADKRDYTQSFRLLSEFTLDSDNQNIVDFFIQRDKASDWLTNYRERLIAEQSDCISRQLTMKSVNPKFVLRNYLAQQAIELAEKGDYSMFSQLNEVLARPFDEHPEQESFAKPPPDWGKAMEISCSS